MVDFSDLGKYEFMGSYLIRIWVLAVLSHICSFIFIAKAIIKFHVAQLLLSSSIKHVERGRLFVTLLFDYLLSEWAGKKKN